MSACALLLAASLARADANPALPSLTIESGPALTVGTPAKIVVLVQLAEGPEQPLLLTPRIEGEAVRVVRGRLSRGDARSSPGWLRFEVPVLARRAGTAVFHVEVLTYHCEAGSCSAVHASASSTLRVGGV